jgi:uncharacterized protein YidB (DUF937 family)
MALFKQVAGALAQGAAGGGQSALTQALGGAFGADSAGGGATVANPMTGLMGAMGGTDGLMGLVAKFKQAGLGQIVESWIGSGPNLPISPEQLKSVLGAPAAEGMAQQAGVHMGTLLASLAQTLPMIVDQLTPGGQLPTDGKLSPDALKNLTGMLGQLGSR